MARVKHVFEQRLGNLLPGGHDLAILGALRCVPDLNLLLKYPAHLARPGTSGIQFAGPQILACTPQ